MQSVIVLLTRIKWRSQICHYGRGLRVASAFLPVAATQYLPRTAGSVPAENRNPHAADSLIVDEEFFDLVRSKYSNVLRPWVMSPTPRTALENVTRPILDRVTLCYVRFECFSLNSPTVPQPFLDSNRSSSLTIRPSWVGSGANWGWRRFRPRSLCRSRY